MSRPLTGEIPPYIRPYVEGDWDAWLRMSLALFSGSAPDELIPFMRQFIQRSDSQVFVAERQDGSVAGFVEVGTRPYADGCDTSPVGYIEAWFVEPNVRRAGYGSALLAAAEDWARQRGYSELASDAILGNEISRRAHMAAGFEEVGRVVQFRKPLSSP